MNVRERIEAARNIYETYGPKILQVRGVRDILESLKESIEQSTAAMDREGVIAACRQCEEEEGGSCCGAGIEDRYSTYLLLVNLLMGADFPEERLFPDSCLFLGKHGCILKARHTLCVNYLCRKIQRMLAPHRLAQLQNVTGKEMDLLFLAYEKVKKEVLKLEQSRGFGKSLDFIAHFYDSCRFGYEGFEGYRKSTDLKKLLRCIEDLTALGILDPARTVFADLGCADGRVNVLMSYFVKVSLGIELDPEILSEYKPRLDGLFSRLQETGLEVPPGNIFLYQGSSLESETFSRIERERGLRFADIDLFYTYITLHDLFAGKIAAEAKEGAFYLVYGFNKILPRYEGLRVIVPDVGKQGIAALYQKG